MIKSLLSRRNFKNSHPIHMMPLELKYNTMRWFIDLNFQNSIRNIHTKTPYTQKLYDIVIENWEHHLFMGLHHKKDLIRILLQKNTKFSYSYCCKQKLFIVGWPVNINVVFSFLSLLPALIWKFGCFSKSSR